MLVVLGDVHAHGPTPACPRLTHADRRAASFAGPAARATSPAMLPGVGQVRRAPGGPRGAVAPTPFTPGGAPPLGAEGSLVPHRRTALARTSAAVPWIGVDVDLAPLQPVAIAHPAR